MNGRAALLAKTGNWSLADDLAEVHARVGDDWRALRDARLFITGATGFIGRWLLETLRYADAAENLGVRVTILSRDPETFARKAPDLAAWPRLTVLRGDVKTFDFPEGESTHVIHAATDASAELNDNNPRAMFDTVVAGARRVFDFAVEAKAGRLLHLSSGAVYGPQPWELELVPEDWRGGPDCANPVNAYAEGKRAAEMLGAIYGKQFGLHITTARIFAVLGPYLPLDTHFAAGNFLRDGMAGRKIVVKSDGRACRSYIYAADLAAALWLMLARGPAGRAFNLGSEDVVSIRELAERVATTLGGAGHEVLGRPDACWNPGRYAPDMSAFTAEFGPAQSVSLEEAILRTARWNGWTPWP